MIEYRLAYLSTTPQLLQLKLRNTAIFHDITVPKLKWTVSYDLPTKWNGKLMSAKPISIDQLAAGIKKISYDHKMLLLK